MSYLWKTIRQSKYGNGFDVHGFYTASQSSVLAGQTLKQFIDSYDTIAQAQAAHPDANMGSSWTDPVVSVNHLPCEDDPVPGGMYPDDY